MDWEKELNGGAVYDDVRAAVRRVLAAPRDVLVRRSVSSGVVWLIFAGVLLTLGGVCLFNFGRVAPGALIGLGLTAGGLWNLVWGLIWVIDRSPVLVLGAEGLIDNRGGAGRRIPWTAVARAQLRRTTRRGVEQSARMMLYVHGLVGVPRWLDVNLADLDHGSAEIFRLIGERANLR